MQGVTNFSVTQKEEITMSTQYITGALLAVLGGWVVVASQAFAPHPLSWIAFGTAVAIVAISLVAQLDRSRGAGQRALDTATLAMGGLLMAFSLIASGTAVTWLSFGLALAVVALGFAGLTMHEVAGWRTAHQLTRLRWIGGGSAGTSLQRSEGRAA
jgi:hypothetical protein